MSSSDLDYNFAFALCLTRKGVDMSLKDFLHPFAYYVRSLNDKVAHCIYKRTEWPLKIERVKNSAVNRRCFIIGNGPSLTISDLDKLEEEDCFACNRIYGVYQRTNWRPKYYCSQDKRVLQQIKEDLPYAIQNCDMAFFPYNFKDMLPENVGEHTYLFFHPYVSVYSKDGTYPEGIMPFSEDVSESVYDGLSITYGMIQIAAYMGYKEIYLIGIDHNYPMKNGVVDAEHSYAEGIKPIDMRTQFPPELLLCENSFRGARQFCESHGIKIVNATRGGRLEVFERMDLDSLIGGES